MGIAYAGLPDLHIPILSGIPIVGPLLFQHDILVYGSILLVLAVAWFLNRTRAGLVLRAVGDSHDAAHAIGYPVLRIRFLAILFGGGMAGIAGAYLSLAYSPLWIENMSAGRGWIALALVVFATWRPWRVFVGAYLFGGITILQLHAQALGVGVPSQVMSMLPYIATIVVLVLISRDRNKIKLNAPACIGKAIPPYRVNGRGREGRSWTKDHPARQSTAESDTSRRRRGVRTIRLRGGADATDRRYRGRSESQRPLLFCQQVRSL